MFTDTGEEMYGSDLERYVVEEDTLGDISVDEIAAVEAVESAVDRYDELLEDGFYKEAADLAAEDLGSFREYRARAGQALENLYVATIGDRVNLMGELAAITSLSGVVMESSAALMMLPLTGLMGITGFGINAVESFRRTEDHIAEHGELDDRFARKGMQQSPFIGNCQEQGAYLAAKKHGELETFEEAQDEASHNVLPNF